MAGLRVGIVSTDWSGQTDSRGNAIPGGANFIRLQQWRPHVDFRTISGALVNHPVKGLGVIDDRGRIYHDLDVLVMQRFMFQDVAKLLAEFKQRGDGPIIVNDLDDWYWGLDKANAAYEACQPENNPTENIDHYRTILQLSDVITVSTPFLENQMNGWLEHPQVVRIENGVDLDAFTQRHHRQRKPIIGWVGSTAHRSRDLEEIQGVIDPGFRVHHTGASVGNPSFAAALGLDTHRLTQVGALAPASYAARGFSFDIGLAPLSDIPFNAAKSWIKPIEYAAAKVPFIASPRAEYVRLHDEYGIGRIAHTHDEWRAHIGELCSFRTRQDEATRQREAVTALNVTRMAQAWTRLIEDLT